MKGLVERLEHPLSAFFVTFAATVPWIALVLLGATPEGEIVRVALTGVSVLGAAFILAWAAETAEEDVPRAFALAVLAVLAVAPEYAVDALYAWKAGAGKATAEACNQLSPSAIEAGATELAEACQAANLAIANMTGANRILIGIGWSGIALYSIYKATSTDDRSVEERDGYLNDRVKLDKDISLEILFLAVATLYAFFVPIADIGAFDMVFLVGLYVVYIYFALQSPKAEEPKVGVPAYLTDLKRRKRIPVVVLLFVYSGIVILVAVEPFAEGLEHIGLRFGISPFLMIQWVAPLASESPELIVTAYLVNKARSTAAFNALISSKLNQWTLLIGTLVLVYSISLGTYGALPLDPKQAGEIWLTAAQSFFALVVLVNLTISVREALALLILFTIQLYPAFHHYEALIGFSAVYIILGTVLLATRLDDLGRLFGLVRERVKGEEGEDDEGETTPRSASEEPS